MSGEARASSPFDPRVVLGLLLFGAAVFVALLWFLGQGMTGGGDTRSGAHVAGTGLDGYAALARYLDARGLKVERVRSKSSLEEPGLLVLTPPHNADPKELTRLVDRRRNIGPTLIVTPKWLTMNPSLLKQAAKPGWVLLAGAESPDWPGFQDNIGVAIKPMRAGGKVAAWRAPNGAGALPNSEFVQSGSSSNIVPLVVGAQDGRVLAGYLLDDGYYPALADIAYGGSYDGEDENIFPVVFVFEPDLIDNYGFADRENAVLGEAIVRAALDTDGSKTVMFDMTLNGFANSDNLLTLAFRPPFLAATLALLLAAIAVGWRAFNRFGPPRLGGREIAFGKRALVSNAAGLIRRTGRLHLIGPPYADAARERLARALALPTGIDAATADKAIDRALAARHGSHQPFSAVTKRLRNANRAADILSAAQDLHGIERTLIQ